jgi:hypothetical protein
MAIEPKSRRTRKAETMKSTGGFDITQVVGRVEIGDGEHTPYEAAFLAIAQFGMPGDFRFPAPMGEGEIRIVVEHDTPHELHSDIRNDVY